MQLTNFERALNEHQRAQDYHQVWRWTKAGRLPRLITWLAQRPALAEALAADAKQIADQKGGEK